MTPKKNVINNKIVTDTNVISGSFNFFYVNIGPTWLKIPKYQRDPLSYIPNNIRGSIFLKDVTYSEVSKIIMLLKNSSPGWDGIHLLKIHIMFSANRYYIY